jgi:uncharacterized RDD family membrane protein YckC
MSDSELTLHTVDAVEVRLELAGVGSRAFAFIIDWHIRALAAAVLAVPLMSLLDMLQARGVQMPSALFLVWLLPMLVYLLYHPVLELAMRGRTPGKRWAGVRIVTLEGATPGAGALLVRNLFRIVDSLPLAYALGLTVMMLTKNQVRIGDIAAGTLVVHDGGEGKDGIAAAARISSTLPPQAQQLLEEWVARWGEIEPVQRDAVAQRTLARVPALAGAAASLSGRELRDHVRRLLDDAR